MTDGPERAQDPGIDGVEGVEGEIEEVDGVPVAAEEWPLPVWGDDGAVIGADTRLPAPARAGTRSLPALRSAAAVQKVAMAAGGFVAGATLVGLVRRRKAAVGRRRRRLILGGRGRRGRDARAGTADLLQIVGSRSFLVDVHLLASPASGGREGRR